MTLGRIWRLLLCVVLLPGVAAAQLGLFGENKIQYRGFDWHVLHGPHVDLYYYPEEDELARVALAYAEESYGVLERRFNHQTGAAPAMIFNTPHRTLIRADHILPFGRRRDCSEQRVLEARSAALRSYADLRHTIRHELVQSSLSLARRGAAYRQAAPAVRCGPRGWPILVGREDTRDIDGLRTTGSRGG